MDILKYIDKKNAEILKKKQAKDKKKEEIKEKIEELEAKVNGEVENVAVIVKSEAKIKILKNKLKKIEEEPPVEGLDEKYIIEEVDKIVTKLSSDLEKKGKDKIEKIYNLIKEMAEEEEEAEKKHSTLKRVLKNNKVTDREIKNLYFNPYRVKNDRGYVTISKSLGYEREHKLVLNPSDFK